MLGEGGRGDVFYSYDNVLAEGEGRPVGCFK